jgi:Leucine-rich repeat (LRR) protein
MKLKVLDLNTTIIEDLSEKIENLQNLRRLNLESTDIIHFTLALNKLKCLEELVISYHSSDYSRRF